MAQMPDERDITKQQLWERIDTAIETISTVGRNTRDNMAAVLPALQRENAMALAELKGALKETVDDLTETLNLKIKYIEKLNNDGFNKTANEGQRIRNDVDTRMRAIEENLNEQLDQKISTSFETLSKKISDFNDTVKDFKKTTDTQMKAMNTEWLTKLGEVKGTFEEMKKKFKKMSEQLS